MNTFANEREVIMKEKKKEVYSKYFIIISCISVATLLISNILSVKLFSIGKLILPSSAILFPITYIIGDVIAEIYGYKKSRFVIILGFICNALMVILFTMAIALPSAETWTAQEAFKTILGTTPRVFVASLSAFLVGSLSNARTMNFIKKKTNGRWLWMRTIGSTIVGELLDTLIFVLIAFTGTASTEVLITMIISQFTWKVAYEILSTPLTYLVINKYKKLECTEKK